MLGDLIVAPSLGRDPFDSMLSDASGYNGICNDNFANWSPQTLDGINFVAKLTLQSRPQQFWETNKWDVISLAI